ncbi:MAG: HlyD family efflux transporter periplasmic adaptor subunit [Deltaproteobacteria bacterium]|nr:HlyD family efflux transporter periplasmic adaptor subunit [Deltaproteobacteria bacterium]
MSRGRRYALVGAALLAGIWGGLWVRGRLAAQTTEVVAGELRLELIARAMVVPIDGIAELRARTDGRVLAVHVREGDRVKAGQLLAELEGDAMQAEVARREAQRQAFAASARVVAEGSRPEQRQALAAQAAAVREQVALAEDRARRVRRLRERGAVAEAQREEADRELGVAKARLELAEAELRLGRAGGRATEVSAARARATAAEAAVAQARSELSRTRLVAPIDGVVLARRVDRGDTVSGVQSGGNTPLFELADTTRVELRVEVEEGEAARLAVGLAVRISLPGGRTTLGRGRLARLGHRLERPTIGAHDGRERAEGWIRAAWVNLEPGWNAAGNFPVGQRLEVAIELPPRKVAAMVPREAVRVVGGHAEVELAKGPFFSALTVELGAADPRFVEVRGVSAGQRVRLGR